MKSMVEIMARVNAEMKGSKFVRIAAGHDPDSRPRCVLKEKSTSRMMGLNALARELGCSRAHLSLVIHGHRKSERLEMRIKEQGYTIQKVEAAGL